MSNEPMITKVASIYTSLNKVMRDVGSVGKDSTNSAQGYKFRGIDALLNAVHPALVKHGVFIIPEVLQSNVEFRDVTRSNGKPGLDKHVQLRVKFTFIAEDGSWVAATTEGEGLDSGDKATNKAMSAALKYALIQTLSIPTEDMDDADRTTPELESKAPARHLTSVQNTGAAASPQAVAPASAGLSASPTPPVAPIATPSSAPSLGAPRRSSFKRQPASNGAAKPVIVASAAPKAADDWS